MDLTEVEKVAVNAQQTMSLGGKVPFSANSKRALVVKNRPQSHAAHMYRIIREGHNIRVFEKLEEAMEWITQAQASAAGAR